MLHPIQTGGEIYNPVPHKRIPNSQPKGLQQMAPVTKSNVIATTGAVFPGRGIKHITGSKINPLFCHLPAIMCFNRSHIHPLSF